MDKLEMRLQCLRLAKESLPNATIGELIEAAEKLFSFVTCSK